MKQYNVVVIAVDERGAVPDIITEDYRSIYRTLDIRLFDIVQVSEEMDMYVDDEGMINGSESNYLATQFLKSVAVANGRELRQQIYGNVLLALHDEEGEHVSMTHEQQRDWVQKINRMEF